MKKFLIILSICFVLFLNKGHTEPIGSGPIGGGAGAAGAAGVEDDVYGAGWNGDAANAPSQNAVYDKIELLDAAKIPAIVSTDNQIVRFDGVGGDVQGSAATITDAGAITNATANADALVLGGASAEGGDIAVYRDGSGNLQLALDADAASNAKALDVYGGVVAQNHLTVGQTALNSTYNLYVTGTTRITGGVVLENYIVLTNNTAQINTGSTSNSTSLALNIPVSGTDATNHEVKLQIDSNDILGAKATGDGAGGVIGKHSILYGGQKVAKTDAGAANYNPSILTSDYIITTNTTAAARAVTISTEDVGTGSAANPRIFIIKDIAGNAAANNITVSLESGGTIDGAANYVINGNYNSITLMIDGTNGYIL